MSITTLFGTRLLSGLGALAIASSVAGGTAIAEAKGKGRGNEVAEARHELKDRIDPEREAIAELRQQMADEYAKADPDEALLQRLHDEIQMHRDKIADMKHEVLVEMHDELDADQRAKVAEKLAGKHEHEGKGKAKGKDKDDGKPGKAKAAAKDKPSKDKPSKDKSSKGKAEAETADR